MPGRVLERSLEIARGLGGWMGGARVAGGRARGVRAVLMAQSGTCSEAAHSLPQCQGQGSQFAFTGGQRPWWGLVSSGLSVAASFASLPRRLAASLSRSTFGLSPLGLQGSEVGGEWVRGRRWVPWSRLSCGPGLRGGGARGGGVGVGVGVVKRK